MKQKNYIFKKTHDVDKNRFAELLNAAKGARTMKDFSEICGVNPSTFTRIIQKTNKGASSTELLEAIAENAAPHSGVTIEALADANGYTAERDCGIKALRLTTMGTNIEILVRNVLVQELIDRKAEVRMGNIRYNFGKTMALSPDALIMTDAFGKKDEVWFVDSIATTMDTKSKSINKVTLKRMTFDRLSRFVFISLNKIELFRPSRYSLVFFDKEIFNLVAEEFSETIVPTYISLILIDTLNSSISDEFVLPQTTEAPQESYFMTTSSVVNDGVEYLTSDDGKIGDFEGGI
ncbi:MAG: hypothetical protein PHV32_15040 [Eubacteriales bacterium]|nr:hypothetical protein [Eubacteriales bacterium]